MPSSEVSFGGWRCAPWYMLDTTNLEARAHLTHIFRTMREEWKVTYFKLDANMWGALPFGERFDKQKTCVEAYRMGMQAILEGAGYNSFLLGCNAPMWPSLGLVHGMRVTNDNARDFSMFTELAKECFGRNWQHNRLWINDPDMVVLRNRDISVMDPSGVINVDSQLTRAEFLYDATYVLASGGMVLSGDDITEFTEENRRDLKKLLPPGGNAGVFEKDDCSVGRIQTEEGQIICIFNSSKQPQEFVIPVEELSEVKDFWSEEDLGKWECGERTIQLGGHSAKVLRLIYERMRE